MMLCISCSFWNPWTVFLVSKYWISTLPVWYPLWWPHCSPKPCVWWCNYVCIYECTVSGIHVLSYVHYTCHDHIIPATMMSFGFGNVLLPNIFRFLFQGIKNPNLGLQGFLTQSQLSWPHCHVSNLFLDFMHLLWKFNWGFCDIVLSAGLVTAVLQWVLSYQMKDQVLKMVMVWKWVRMWKQMVMTKRLGNLYWKIRVVDWLPVINADHMQMPFISQGWLM